MWYNCIRFTYVNSTKLLYGGNNMIDTRNYELIDANGYESKADAYDTIRDLYFGIPGVTTFFNSDDGLWYIVQSKALR